MFHICHFLSLEYIIETKISDLDTGTDCNAVLYVLLTDPIDWLDNFFFVFFTANVILSTLDEMQCLYLNSLSLILMKIWCPIADQNRKLRVKKSNWPASHLTSFEAECIICTSNE